MINTLKLRAAQALMALLVVAGIGFGVLAAGLALVLGAVALLAVAVGRPMTADTAKTASAGAMSPA